MSVRDISIGHPKPLIIARFLRVVPWNDLKEQREMVAGWVCKNASVGTTVTVDVTSDESKTIHLIFERTKGDYLGAVLTLL